MTREMISLTIMDNQGIINACLTIRGKDLDKNQNIYQLKQTKLVSHTSTHSASLKMSKISCVTSFCHGKWRL